MMARWLVALHAVGVLGGEVAFKTKASSRGPFAVQSTASNEWLLRGSDRVLVGGDYDWDAQRWAPNALSVAVKDTARPKVQSAVFEVPYVLRLRLKKPFSGAPKPVGSAALGSSALSVELDTEAAAPKRVSLQRKLLGGALTLRPVFSPREARTPTKGLELQSRWAISGSRTVVNAAVAPNTRPRLDFAFEVDAEASTYLRMQPLLGENAEKTSYEVEKFFRAAPGAEPLVRSVAATLYDGVLQLRANLPVGIENARGTLTPSLSCPVDDIKSTRLTLSPSFNI